MISLKAKFRVFEVANLIGPDGKTITQRVKLAAVYGNNAENAAWAKATPSGQIEMSIDNPGAHDILSYGKEFYVTFEDAQG